MSLVDRASRALVACAATLTLMPTSSAATEPPAMPTCADARQLPLGVRRGLTDHARLLSKGHAMPRPHPVVGAALAAAVTVAAGQSAEPPAGEILFTTNRDGNYEIYVMAVDGTGVRNLTQHPSLDYAASWSPDGARVVFQSNRSGNYDLYVMPAGGGEAVNLTNHPAADVGATWSPDGQRIVFASDRDQARRELYVMRADGTDVRRLTHNTQYEETPVWAPDGTRLAFTRQVEEPAAGGHAGNGEIFVMAADGTGERRVTTRSGFDSAPSWSPDGRRLAFHGAVPDGFDLFVVGVDGSGLQPLTQGAPEEYQPAWSADGAWLAYCAGEGQEYDIWVMRPDGTDRRRLTTTAGRDQQPAWRPRATR